MAKSPSDPNDAADNPNVPFDTLFDDAQCPVPGNTGDWGGSTGGDTSGALAAAGKGVEGEMPEVTYVDVQEAPAYGGGKAPMNDIAGHNITKDFLA
jgi:hypothetical protein